MMFWESRRGGEWFFPDMFWVIFWDCNEAFFGSAFRYLYENLMRKMGHERDFNEAMVFTISKEEGLALELILNGR